MTDIASWMNTYNSLGVQDVVGKNKIFMWEKQRVGVGVSLRNHNTIVMSRNSGGTILVTYVYFVSQEKPNIHFECSLEYLFKGENLERA